MVIQAVINDGVAIPEKTIFLPNGTKVEIVISESDESAALQKEMEEWERLGRESWAMIDNWEKEDFRETR